MIRLNQFGADSEYQAYDHLVDFLFGLIRLECGQEHKEELLEVHEVVFDILKHQVDLSRLTQLFKQEF